MHYLYMLRHAKSSWRNAELADIDRPLKKRGIKNAQAIGRLIARRDKPLDLIISSPSQRTLQTRDILLTTLDYQPTLQVVDSLYLGNPADYIDIIRQTDKVIKRLMLIGHNDGIEQTVQQLSGHAITMKTATLVIMAFKGDWSSFVKIKSLEVYYAKDLKL